MPNKKSSRSAKCECRSRTKKNSRKSRGSQTDCLERHEFEKTLLEFHKKEERDVLLYFKLNLFDYFIYVNRCDDVMKLFCEYKQESKKYLINRAYFYLYYHEFDRSKLNDTYKLAKNKFFKESFDEFTNGLVSLDDNDFTYVLYSEDDSLFSECLQSINSGDYRLIEFFKFARKKIDPLVHYKAEAERMLALFEVKFINILLFFPLLKHRSALNK